MDPLTHEQFHIQVGDEVVDLTDQKVGTVTAFDTRVVTVEHGLFRKDNYFVPVQAINACNDGKIHLNVSKDDMEAQGFDVPPIVPTDADGAPL
ncbi:hypothetical protein BH23CHL5_BH23CHL5_17280 [soil metagenome]